MRVVILVTHLLGTGHLSRAATLGRAFAQAGHEVDLISGGTPVSTVKTEGLKLHQLPPVKSDGIHFNRLLDSEGHPADQEYLINRQNGLVRTVSDLMPDALITELFPFGRRVLRAEFTAALRTAQSLQKVPKIFASIRDILAPPSTPRKAAETDAVIADSYDAVLVHSNPDSTPLEASWPVSSDLANKLIYTGYVAPPPPQPHPQRTGTGEVLVTAGGGSVGTSLFEAAVAAAKLDTANPWRLLVGGSDKDTIIRSLQQQAGHLPITIEPARADFRHMLNHAAASVSMCGYNTAIDLLQTGTPGVFVPFDLGGETEQTLRAESLATRPEYQLIPNAGLTPAGLASAVNRIAGRRVSKPQSQFDGAAETVRVVQKFVG